MSTTYTKISKKCYSFTGKPNEYLEKYLFPFEKPGGSTKGYFELVLSLDKCFLDDKYLSRIEFPADIKYLCIILRHDLQDSSLIYTLDDEYKIYKKIRDIIPHHIEYLKCQDLSLSRLIHFTNLKTLILEDTYIQSFDNLPLSLIRFEFLIENYNYRLDNLPPNLKFLLINVNCGYIYSYGYPHPLDNLPHSLEVLYFPETVGATGTHHPGNINNLPSGLKYLYLPQSLQKNTDYNNLPESLEVIEFQNYPYVVDNIYCYPSSLQKIFSNTWYYYENDKAEMQYEKVKKKIKSLNLEGKFEIYFRQKPNHCKTRFEYKKC